MGEIAKSATTLQQANPQNDFKALLASQWDRIKAVMPSHMSENRLFQLAVSAYNSTPELAECTTVSVLSCVMKCAALGLEPSAVDGLGRACILPYRNGKTKRYEANFILGYRGMIDLARKSGEIKDINAHAVYEGDTFSYSFGLNEDLTHVPSNEPKAGRQLTHAYCVAHFKNGGHYFNVLTREDIEQARKSSRAANSSYSPWKTHFEQMAVKTAIRRAFPYLPVSIEAQDAAASDDRTPDYSAQLAPVIVTATETQPEPEPADEQPEPRRAVCRSCGAVVDNVAPDALASDIAFECCDKPAFEIVEG